jgi:hypothetical protein
VSDAYDADEHHPEDWPSNADREDLPDTTDAEGWDDEKGKPLDANGRPYNPYQGSHSPTEDRCNALLDAWEDRYGEARYCMRLPVNRFVDGGSKYCKVHKSREDLMERARDVFKHGLYSKTIKHVFGKLSPWQQLVCLGFYDSYVGESHYDYESELHDFTIDFSVLDDDVLDGLPLEVQLQLGEDEQMDIGVPIPTTHEVRAFALFRAAVKDMQVTLADSEMLPQVDEDDAAMEREMIVGVEQDEEGNVEQVHTQPDEHHLALPVSRVDKDREELLRFGGVPVDSDADIEVTAESPDSLIMDLGDDEAESKTAVESDSPAAVLEEQAAGELEDGE